MPKVTKKKENETDKEKNKKISYIPNQSHFQIVIYYSTFSSIKENNSST